MSFAQAEAAIHPQSTSLLLRFRVDRTKARVGYIEEDANSGGDHCYTVCSGDGIHIA
jgi:hypothetical protein